jgi:hypothetical protein
MVLQRTWPEWRQKNYAKKKRAEKEEITKGEQGEQEER